jgi:hypothetical protein
MSNYTRFFLALGILLLGLAGIKPVMSAMRVHAPWETIEDVQGEIPNGKCKRLGVNDYLVTVTVDGVTFQARGAGRWWRTYPEGVLLDRSTRVLLEQLQAKERWRPMMEPTSSQAGPKT